MLCNHSMMFFLGYRNSGNITLVFKKGKKRNTRELQASQPYLCVHWDHRADIPGKYAKAHEEQRGGWWQSTCFTKSASCLQHLMVFYDGAMIGVWVDEKLDMSWQWAHAAWKSSHIQVCIKKHMDSRFRTVIFPFYLAIVRPFLDYYIQIWCSTTKTWRFWSKEIPKMIREMKHFSYEEKLRELELFSLRRGGRAYSSLSVYNGDLWEC